MDAGNADVRTVLVGGGVSANRRLRAELAAFGSRRGIAVRIPAIEHCLDNAAMVAALAHWRLAAGECDGLTLGPQAQSALGRPAAG
jgi:N6-L-threonylcarbamoyladenine synthase